MDKINSLTGMPDLISQKNDLSNKSNKIFETEKVLIKIFERYSLNEIRTPALENESLFNRSVGNSSDIVNKELYAFLDKNNKKISLRPEGTAGVARSVIEKKLDNEPHRFWYLGPMWRYERPQKGRYRQFYQAGIELLGYFEGLAELEMISMILSINDALGIKDSKIKINHLGNKEAKDKFCEALQNYLKPLSSKLEKLDLDRLNKNPLRVLDSKSDQTKDILKDAPKMNEFVSKESLDLLNLIKNSFSEQNIEIDYSLVRGLDYYTGFIFEAISDDLGSQDSYLGGGRYDNLFNDLGGKKLPAIGMAIGIERLAEISNFSVENKTLISFIVLSDKIEQKAYKIAHEFRYLNNNIVIEVQLSDGSLKSKLRKANKDKADFAIIIGDEELKNKTLVLKPLKEKDSDQKILSIEDAKKFISSLN